MSAGAPGPALAQDFASPPMETVSTVRVHLVPVPRTVGSPDPTVGDPTWVTVVTRGPAGWSLLPGSLEKIYDGHPEAAVLDTDRRDGRVRLKLAVFRPGDVVLPEGRARVLTASGDTLMVPVTADTLRVASVLTPGDTLLAEIKPLWVERGVPPWVWILLAALAALALAALALRRRRRAPVHVRSVATSDPYGDARVRIIALGAEPGTPARAMAAAAGIADALRGYLADGWGIGARERTTFETLSLLPEAPDVPRGAVGSVLGAADLAKFAKVAPSAGEVAQMSERALEALDRMETARRGRLAATTAREAS